MAEAVDEKKEKKKKKSKDPAVAGEKSKPRKSVPSEPDPEPAPDDTEVTTKQPVVRIADPPEVEEPSGIKSPVDIIREILSPKMSIVDPNLPYEVPIAVKPGDVEALQDLDERKLIELKEAFMIFDLDGDGCIDAEDLRGTFGTLGDTEIPEELIDEMLSEAMDPLDFDSFVMLMGYKTIEMDPEDVLVEALSKWDLHKQGVIDEEKLRHDLMCYGDRLTESEVDYALEEAPITNKNRTPDEHALIDYAGFCRVLAGFRKRKTTT